MGEVSAQADVLLQRQMLPCVKEQFNILGNI